jgi:putative transposase
MTSVTTKPDSSQPAAETCPALFDDWFDPVEAGLRERVRGFIEEMIREELNLVLARPRYGRRQEPTPGAEDAGAVVGHRHASRERSLTGTFGKTASTVPRARLEQPDGTTTSGGAGHSGRTSGAPLRPTR